MFSELLNRNTPRTNWSKIPWDDPDFSRRMLAEHLDQSHDLASRRSETIDAHVDWIQHDILNTTPANILDLGCGPGFYTRRFAQLRHTVTGIDFSPASIDYARQQDTISTYVQGNVLEIDYGQGYDLISMIYGELNAFSPEDAKRIVEKTHAALNVGGAFLMEVHTVDVIQRIGETAPTWYTSSAGLFADTPHIVLMESSFENRRSVTNFYVIDAQTGAMQTYCNMLYAHEIDGYRELLDAFNSVTVYSSLDGHDNNGDLFVIVATK